MNVNAPNIINAWVVPGILPGTDENYARNLMSDVNRMIGADVTAHTRVRHICEARQVICYLLRLRTQLTLFRIAELLKIDHSSVVYSTKVVANLLTYDKGFRQRWAATIDNQLPTDRVELSQMKDTNSHPRICGECQYLTDNGICSVRRCKAWPHKAYSKTKCNVYFNG